MKRIIILTFLMIIFFGVPGVFAQEKEIDETSGAACPTEEALVCGDNGLTFLNECIARVHGVKVQYVGRCREEDQKAVCPLDFDPVCGENGLTYRNACMAKMHGFSIQYQGRCRTDEKAEDKDEDRHDNEKFLYWLKDIYREINDRRQWVEKLQKEDPAMAEKVNAVVSRMQLLFEAAKSAFDAGKVETVAEVLQGFDTLREEFEKIMRGVFKKREEDFFFKDLEHMVREIDRAEQKIKTLLTHQKIDPKQADLCLGHVQQGRSLIDQLKRALAVKEEGQIEKLRWQFEQLGRLAERDCRDVLDQGPDQEYFDGFNQSYIDQKHHTRAQSIYQKVNKEVAKKVLEHLKDYTPIFNDMLEKVGGQFEEEIAQVLEAVSVVPEEFEEEYLSRKTLMLEKMKEMEALTTRLQHLKKIAADEFSELMAIKAKIAEHNFVGESGAEMEEEVEAFLVETDVAELSQSDLQDKIKVFKSKAEEKFGQSKREKLEKGIIPFVDSDDKDWWTKYAIDAKREGFVKGTGVSNFTELNPAGMTNVAEAVTLFGRVAANGIVIQNGLTGDDSVGIVIQNGLVSIVIKNGLVLDQLPDWARPAGLVLQNQGVDLDAIFGNKAPHAAISRAEAARLMKAVFDLSSGKESFIDTAVVSAPEQEAIAAVNSAGIMTGEGDGTNFNPHGALNRAALVKVLIKAQELQNPIPTGWIPGAEGEPLEE